jgi:hypothetical protein
MRVLVAALCDLAAPSPSSCSLPCPALPCPALYRNPMSEAARFLAAHHPGAARVYNLCAERCYGGGAFGAAGGGVVHLALDDHQVRGGREGGGREGGRAASGPGYRRMAAAPLQLQHSVQPCTCLPPTTAATHWLNGHSP